MALAAWAGALSPANAQDAKVSLQVVNLAEGALVRVRLDPRPIYESAPTKKSVLRPAISSQPAQGGESVLARAA